MGAGRLALLRCRVAVTWGARAEKSTALPFRAPDSRLRQSNLADGASTIASPFSTGLPSTVQTQASVTRRLA